MGNKGPDGSKYDQHVHYQMKDSKGKIINPENYWDNPAENNSGKSNQSAKPVTRQGTSDTYEVKSGDALGKIAQKHGTTVKDIMQANPGITNPNAIKVGQKIKIPGKEKVAAASAPKSGGSGANVLINGLTAVHAASQGILTTIDVCWTKIGKPVVPIPYTNVARSADAAKTASTVFINGNPVCHQKSIFSKSAGDEPGSRKGVVSGTIKGKAEFVTGSPNVFIEGIPAARQGDMMVSNNGNTSPMPLSQPGAPRAKEVKTEQMEELDESKLPNEVPLTVSGGALHIQHDLVGYRINVSDGNPQTLNQPQRALAPYDPDQRNDTLDTTLATCTIALTFENELTTPSNRKRTRIGAKEIIAVTAADAKGDVTWAIKSGRGQFLEATANFARYEAHEVGEKATIEARDSANCTIELMFDVVCDYLVPHSIFSAIFPNAPQTRIDALTNAFNEAYQEFNVNTCLRRAHFFAQALTEVGLGASPKEENMNYTPDGLKNTFKYFRRHPSEADLYGRTADHQADQEAIANRAYANRMGNGDIASGDGWRFRGRGYIQLTGRSNYERVQREIDLKFPTSGVDIVNNFSDIVTPRGGLISAMAFWSLNNLDQVAEGGATNAVVDLITDVVNRHTNHRQKRIDFFNNTTKLEFKVAECPNSTTPPDTP
jgi:putative chitinase